MSFNIINRGTDYIDISFNPLKSGQCLSMAYSREKVFTREAEVSIPLNRVNVFQFQVDDEADSKLVRDVSIPLNRVNVFQCYGRSFRCRYNR